MTRTQIKSIITKIVDELDTLKMEVEETSEEIEPYEGKDELTFQQEERQEWLDDLVYDLETIIDTLEERL